MSLLEQRTQLLVLTVDQRAALRVTGDFADQNFTLNGRKDYGTHIQHPLNAIMYRHYPLVPPAVNTSPFSQASNMNDFNPFQTLYDKDYWLACLDSLNSTMYNSPSATLPPFPHQHHAISAYDKKDRLGPERGENQSNPEIPDATNDITSNSKNDEYFSFQNFYEFRQARSDHVMGRLRLHFRFNGLSIRRLQSGHYILHQGTPEGSVFDLSETEADKAHSTDEWMRKRRAVMARFGSAIAAPKVRSRFVPYSFSTGARYCSPYRVHDVLLRCAYLPTW